MADDDVLIETRTAAEVDDRCGMAYWWEFEEGGTGIVPNEPAIELTTGAETHEDQAEIAAFNDDELEARTMALVERILQEAPQDHLPTNRMEHLYRRAGWAAASGLFMEPLVRGQFTTHSIEQDIILDRNPLWVPITPDRVLVSRGEDPYWVYREYKSTISAGPKWMASWIYAVQLHAGMKAIEEETGHRVAYAQIVGLMKGDNRGSRLSHPYVWGWRSTKTGAWTHDYTKARTAEWEHAPVWEYEPGLVEWVRKCGSEVALAQFPHSAPVFLNERILNDWITRRTARQNQIEEIRAECQHDWDTRVIYFEPRTKQCRPAFGSECPFLRCCNSAEVNENPLAYGFRRRVPHHELEAIGVE